MESFFRRMSSIVRKNNNKSFDPDENEQENHGDDNERHKQFRYMQGRRRSAPDMRRRTIPVGRIPTESDQEFTSVEQINSSKMTLQTSTSILPRKHYYSTGKLFSLNK
jgi:hypothetical protein